MREIKFRAWNTYHKKMYPVYMLNFESDLVYCKGDDYASHTFGLIDCKVMQFTGCQDFFGNDIYEGDIVFIDSKMMVGKIFNDGISWRIQFEKDLDWLCDYFEDLHVIGNEYENPELLK